MSIETFRHNRRVEYALCDHRGQARLSHLLAMAQQISMEHCEAAGIGGRWFFDRGYAFLLAKLRLEIAQLPEGGSVLELYTRPNMPMRAQFRRLTTFADQAGQPLVQMDSRWVLVDTASRRLVRRLPEDVCLPFFAAEEMADFRAQPPAQGQLELWGEEIVRYSMLDINGHMNNAVYGDLVCNLLEQPLMADRRLASVELFYHREALPGDCIQLYHQLVEDQFYIKGVVGDATCFEASGRLAPVL